MKVLVSCPQAQSVLDEVRGELDAGGVEIALPAVRQALDETALIELVRDVDGVLAGDDAFTERVFAHAPRLRVVSKFGAGTDSIDKRAAARHGVVVTNTPGLLNDDVADVVVGYLVMLSRGLHTIDRSVRDGSWAKIEGRSLTGAVLGIVGLGAIGRAVATRAAAMRMRVVACDTDAPANEWAIANGVEMLAFDEMLPLVDYLTLHCPLTEHNRRMLDARAFARMRRGTYLINTARGGLVDDDALAQAIRAGTVAGAALDVHSVEPVPVNHSLLQFPNVVFGSHNASNTRDANLRATRAAIENLVKGLMQ
jgi:D-3-phosphoglycerate dehydrogenase